MSPSPPRSVLVFGCGYLGRPAASAWAAAGRRVYAVTRGRAAELAAAGFEPVVADVLDPDSLRNIPEADTVLYAVGLDRRAGANMRAVYVGGLTNVLGVIRPPRRFLYVSSTSPYGQTDGGWVDETSPTEPIDGAGTIVRDAERVLRERRPDAIVLRFAGLYGPGRLLREKAILAGEPLAGDAEKWLNLVHVADGARAVLAAEERAAPGETYLISDGEPVRRRDFYTELGRLLGVPAKFEPAATLVVEANRRVSNRKAREQLGWEPAFRSYREGLADAVS